MTYYYQDLFLLKLSCCGYSGLYAFNRSYSNTIRYTISMRKLVSRVDKYFTFVDKPYTNIEYVIFYTKIIILCNNTYIN